MNSRATSPGAAEAADRAIVREIVFTSDDGGFCYRSGRFSAHAEVGGDVVQGPAGVMIEEALAWARSRADVVIVETREPRRRFSAGRTQPTRGRLPEWPRKGGRSVAAV